MHTNREKRRLVKIAPDGQDTKSGSVAKDLIMGIARSAVWFLALKTLLDPAVEDPGQQDGFRRRGNYRHF